MRFQFEATSVPAVTFPFAFIFVGWQRYTPLYYYRQRWLSGYSFPRTAGTRYPLRLTMAAGTDTLVPGRGKHRGIPMTPPKSPGKKQSRHIADGLTTKRKPQATPPESSPRTSRRDMTSSPMPRPGPLSTIPPVRPNTKMGGDDASRPRPRKEPAPFGAGSFCTVSCSGRGGGSSCRIRKNRGNGGGVTS